MSYKVQFVGLTCFWNEGGKGKVAYLPDGRVPPPNTRAHIASISVRTGDLMPEQTRGWRDDEVCADRFETEFFFQPSQIEFPSSSIDKGNAPLNATDLDSRLVRIESIDDRFTIDANANWIGRIDVSHGTIEALRWPGAPEDVNAALLAEWTVDHEGEILLRVTARKGWPVRTIALKPNSEIAVINMSRGLSPLNLGGDHFEIYSELSAVPVTLSTPPSPNTTPPPALRSSHPTYRAPRPATDVSMGCSPITGGSVG